MNLTGNGKVVLSGCLSAAACVRLVLYYCFFCHDFCFAFCHELEGEDRVSRRGVVTCVRSRCGRVGMKFIERTKSI